MKKTLVTALLLGAIAPCFTGCATIMDGSSQTVGISSTPSGALVTVDGRTIGNTPLTIDLKRKDNHTVKIALDGYHPYEMTLIKKTNSWVWGNIVFGGLIGLVVDAASGSMYKLTPEQVNAELRNNGNAAVNTNENTIMVAVTLNPQDSWQKIGELKHL